jgi:hypothetical protein
MPPASTQLLAATVRSLAAAVAFSFSPQRQAAPGVLNITCRTLANEAVFLREVRRVFLASDL